MVYKKVIIQDEEYFELICDNCKAWTRKANDDQGRLSAMREGWVMSGDKHFCYSCKKQKSRRPR